MGALTLGHTEPVAKIQHGCILCGRTIEPGEKYDRWRIVDYDFGPGVVKQCAHCSALVRIFGDEFIYDWHEGFSEEDVRDWDPETAAGRLVRQQFLARWRDSAGALVDVICRPGCGICGQPLDSVGTSRCYEAHGVNRPGVQG